MPWSTVIVEFPSGAPARGVPVALGFASGTTSRCYTGNDGRAVIEHASTGRAVVYVRGARCQAFHAPGEAVVVLRCP